MILNEQFNPKVYKIVNEPGMWAYISHYTWVVIAVVYVVKPLGMMFFPAVLTALILAEIMIYLSYTIWLGIQCVVKSII